jgi:hypothetical protein
MAFYGYLQKEYSVRQRREEEERHLVAEMHTRKRCDSVAASVKGGRQMQ